MCNFYSSMAKKKLSRSQKQKGNTDHGIFAIIIATDINHIIVFGIKPTYVCEAKARNQDSTLGWMFHNKADVSISY